MERYRALVVKVQSSKGIIENHAHVWATAIAISVFSFLVNIPKFFEIELVEAHNGTANMTEYYLDFTNLNNDFNYGLFYDIIFSNVILFAVPLASLAYLNLKIFLVLKQRLATYSRKERRVEVRMYTVLFSVVLVLAVCHSVRVITFVRSTVSLLSDDVKER